MKKAILLLSACVNLLAAQEQAIDYDAMREQLIDPLTEIVGEEVCTVSDAAGAMRVALRAANFGVQLAHKKNSLISSNSGPSDESFGDADSFDVSSIPCSEPGIAFDKKLLQRLRIAAYVEGYLDRAGRKKSKQSDTEFQLYDQLVENPMNASELFEPEHLVAGSKMKARDLEKVLQEKFPDQFHYEEGPGIKKKKSSKSLKFTDSQLSLEGTSSMLDVTMTEEATYDCSTVPGLAALVAERDVLQEMIGLVGQDGLLSNGTIENIVLLIRMTRVSSGYSKNVAQIRQVMRDVCASKLEYDAKVPGEVRQRAKVFRANVDHIEKIAAGETYSEENDPYYLFVERKSDYYGQAGLRHPTDPDYSSTPVADHIEDQLKTIMGID